MNPPRKDHLPNLDEIKQQIASYQEDIERTYLEVGRLFWKAKELFGKHGEWLKWLEKNVDMSICKVQRLMKVARWMDGNEAPVPHLPFSKAYILSRLSSHDLEKFLDQDHPNDDSSKKSIRRLLEEDKLKKQELEKAVRDFLRNRNDKPSINQVPKQTENHPSR